MEYKDYYKTLGVDRNASQDEIKKAYRRLARKYHPDVSEEKDAEARFKEISEAYEVLGDPEKRATYDQLGSRWQQGEDFRPPPGWEFHGGRRGARGGADADSVFSDFFESIFGGGDPFGRGEPFGGGDPFAGGRAQGFRARGSGFRARGEDQHARITITLEDAYHGATRNLNLQTQREDGQVEPRQVRVKIPPGVTQGKQIRLAGQGPPGMGGGSRGDLYLEVNIAPHRQYRLQGKDVYLDLPVTPWEAALGATVKVPTLGGWIDMKIPPGAQNGQRFRLKGRGLPGKPPGDQYAELSIVTPRADTDSARELYERMSREMPMNPRENLTVS
ncbi:DnaJ C-terminal domain-containing protein [Aquisalimonas lutea]|uniref:DnaJ C-terminal domain-containing protein n=1 Tax=Aquisalimonas lutea TaxID=1327750 RepID=UPI0025B3B070|nr:DnaJ C-terminal domain-containing protein [Aquisalimonas lutea]MDN3516825.1 DnaJ C-terminal domain-containing protein [Aquisalimonas lutea]